MRRLDGLDWFAGVLTIIGAINWGLIGLFKFDLVAALFGNLTAVSRVIYTIIGVCGLYLIYTLSKYGSDDVVKDRD